MMALSLPRRPKGRPTADQKARFDADLDVWCDGIKEINSGLDFRVSSRGWCYVLEELGSLLKGDFDVAQSLINDCRKSGRLPLNICSDDDGRAPEGLEVIDDDDVEDEAAFILDYVLRAQNDFNPFSFWDYQDKYIEILTEKVDLKSLFSRICRQYHIPDNK